MSLQTRIKAAGAAAATVPVDAGRHRAVKRRTKRAVMDRMGYDEVARISAYIDPARARSELRPAVEAALNVEEPGDLATPERETIIDEDAVDAALRGGRLSWFSCDFATPKTVKMPNTFITTHSGAGTGEAEANCADMAISELKDYLENGNIAHSVNYPACSMGKARAASRIACLHANVPNMIGQITAILAKDNANVQRMTNESAGENAYTMFDTDEHLDSSTIEALKQIPSMYRVRVIK